MPSHFGNWSALLSDLFSYYEDSSEENIDIQTFEGCLSGLGTGLLSSIALSLTSSLVSLPEIGAEVVRVAFRLGVQVNEVSENLKIRAGLVEAGPGDSWAYVVPDVVAQEVQEELDAYHTSRVRYLDIPLEVLTQADERY